MFEYRLEKIVNGWLVTVTAPDKILADKLYKGTEIEAWETINEMTAAHIEECKVYGNSRTHTS